MHRGILQALRNFRKIHLAFPDQLLAFSQLNPADILTGGNGQMLLKQRRQIAGADTYPLRHNRHSQFFRHMTLHILLCPADGGVLPADSGAFFLLFLIPELQKQQGQQAEDLVLLVRWQSPGPRPGQ